LRLLIGRDALERAELARVSHAGDRAEARGARARERDALDAAADLGRLVALQRRHQPAERLDGGRRQRACGFVLGRRIEERQQMIERAAIAERAEREQCALHLRRLTRLRDEEQRLERLGTAA
jgi:hypothetical protein